MKLTATEYIYKLALLQTFCCCETPVPSAACTRCIFDDMVCAPLPLGHCYRPTCIECRFPSPWNPAPLCHSLLQTSHNHESSRKTLESVKTQITSNKVFTQVVQFSYHSHAFFFFLQKAFSWFAYFLGFASKHKFGTLTNNSVFLLSFAMERYW